MPHFELLGSLMRDLHNEFVRIYYLMLPVFFALSVTIAWFRSPHGGAEFIDTLKRTVVATLLLVAFPEISQAIIFIADGIAEKIDSLNSIDAIIRMAQQKSQTYSHSSLSLLIQFDDLIIAGLSFCSYLVLYCARYLMIAMYHFYWVFFMASAPLLLLFNLFPATSHITTNLFKGMVEVACWKIVWAIMGAMLASLSFGEMYQSDGSYVELIVMNFVIAIAMLRTPKIVSSLTGGGAHSTASEIGTAAVVAMIAAPARAKMALTAGGGAVNSAGNFARSKIDNYRDQKRK
jgi:hypothetical protein